MNGRLMAQAGRLELQLEGRLSITSSDGEVTLHGELLDGRRATVLGCELAHRSFGTPERYPERWHVARSLVGSWVDDAAAAAFRSLRVHIGGLAEAVGRPGLSVVASDITRSGPDDRVTVEWERPGELVADFGARTLTLRPHPRFEHDSDFRLAVSSHVVAIVTGPEPLSLDDVDDVLNDLVSLVALSTECATSVQRLELLPVTDGPTTIVSDRGRTVYGARPELTDPRFTFDSLGERGEAFITAFAAFRRDQPEAAELLFEYQVFNAVLTSPDRLLYLARFFEAYHRRQSPSQFPFVERVTSLLEGAGAAAQEAFGASATELAEAIRDTRNYYVHYNPKDRDRAHHGVPLDGLADRVWCAVRAVLWSDLGMDNDTITEILATDWRYTAAAGTRLPIVGSPHGPEATQ
ncbi:MAG: hypothetical protein JWR63_4395 [Conexibacter sp.]|nr:hypothetical protein [Conexibacter sp.]